MRRTDSQLTEALAIELHPRQTYVDGEMGKIKTARRLNFRTTAAVWMLVIGRMLGTNWCSYCSRGGQLREILKHGKIRSAEMSLFAVCETSSFIAGTQCGSK
jgi:hypothetical protein